MRRMSVRGSKKSGMATGLMLAGAVSVLALPSAVLAFSSRFEGPPARVEVRKDIGTYNSSAQDAQLASASVRSLAQGHPFHFTPAGTPTRPDRSVTVAVRVDPQTARTITVRGTAPTAVTAGNATLHIAPTGFSLGVSRGYQNFAQSLVTPVEIQKIEMPDLASYKSGPAAKNPNSRFTPRIALDDKPTSGRAPRTFVESEDTVDVGGSLRVSRNLDVTAGVRYSQELERLRPLTDGKQDNQAVYVGTQYRF
jgi:hypothetical protein